MFAESQIGQVPAVGGQKPAKNITPSRFFMDLSPGSLARCSDTVTSVGVFMPGEYLDQDRTGHAERVEPALCGSANSVSSVSTPARHRVQAPKWWMQCPRSGEKPTDGWGFP